jgi:predicted nucleotidyltransferase
MDINKSDFLDLWRALNEKNVRYILVGGFATNLHGFQRFTGDVDIYLEDTLLNRQKLREAYKAYCNIDFQSFETIQFVPGWVEFPLKDGTRLDIMTSLVGVDATFAECLQSAHMAKIDEVTIPVLHIQHLIDNKKAVGRPKDQLDVLSLERIQSLLKPPGESNKSEY